MSGMLKSRSTQPTPSCGAAARKSDGDVNVLTS